jgi:hypothetical protein
MTWLVVLALGLGAGTLSGIVGFGASIMLMPALMLAFGPLEAVPIMAIAGMLANFARVAVWWREVDWRANAFYCVTAIPMAALGARTLLLLDARIVEGILGLLFLLMIPMRRWLFARGLRIVAWQLSIVGAAIGFLSGLVASTGPINTPFFLAYGLVKGAAGDGGARPYRRRLADGGLETRQGLRAAARRAPVPQSHGLPARRRRPRAAVGRFRAGARLTGATTRSTSSAPSTQASWPRRSM